MSIPTSVVVTGDVLAGAAVIASWSSELRDELAIIVSILAGLWYLVQLWNYVKSNWDSK